MKKIYFIGALLATTMSFGQVILSEGFNYTVPGFVGGNGSTGTVDAVGSNNWYTHSNTAGNATTIDLSSGSLSYAGILAPTGNKIGLIGSNSTTPRDINRGFTSTATTLYYSAMLNIIDNTQLASTLPLTGTNSYFLSFGDKSGGITIANLAGRLAAVSTNTGANYRFLIQNNSSGTTPAYTENAVDLNFGTTYFVVVKLEILAGNVTTASLWVNPALATFGAAEPATTVINNAGTSTAFTSFSTGSIVVRNASNTPKVDIDEIRVGVTWADVTPVALSTQDFGGNISGLKVYPNPAKTVLNITSDSFADKNVEIYNVLGKVVMTAKVTNAPINVASLASGVYVVKVTEEGKSATRRLVIE